MSTPNPHENQTWWSIYQGMSLSQLKAEQERIHMTQFTDKDARLAKLATEVEKRAGEA